MSQRRVARPVSRLAIRVMSARPLRGVCLTRPRGSIVACTVPRPMVGDRHRRAGGCGCAATSAQCPSARRVGVRPKLPACMRLSWMPLHPADAAESVAETAQPSPRRVVRVVDRLGPGFAAAASARTAPRGEPTAAAMGRASSRWGTEPRVRDHSARSRPGSPPWPLPRGASPRAPARCRSPQRPVIGVARAACAAARRATGTRKGEQLT